MKFLIALVTGIMISLIVENNGGTLTQSLVLCFTAGLILGLVDAVASRE